MRMRAEDLLASLSHFLKCQYVEQPEITANTTSDVQT